MQARYPDVEGFVEQGDVRIGYQVFGDGEPTILLLPTWTIVHSRFWKMQIPYLARHYRVVTFDGPGNGRSEQPLDSAPYTLDSIVADAVAVLDATDTERAVVISLSKGGPWSLGLAAGEPDRVLGQVFIGPTLPLTPQSPERARVPKTFMKEIDDPRGWEKYNSHYWQANYEDFARFFFSQCLTEPHSTKQREDSLGWAMETTPDVLLVESTTSFAEVDRDRVLEFCKRISSPTLVIQGTNDQISPISRGRALAEATNGRLIAIERGGHFPMARDPVKVNLAIRQFVECLPKQVVAA